MPDTKALTAPEEALVVNTFTDAMARVYLRMAAGLRNGRQTDGG